MTEQAPPDPPSTVQPESQSPASPSSLPPFPPIGAPPPDLDSILRAATSAPAHPQGIPVGRPVLRSPRPTMERYDERCWTRTRQTNARRALGREPQVTMYCYLNFRNSLADLVPVPGAPNAFLARDAHASTSSAADPSGKGKGKEVVRAPEHEDLPAYHWDFLDGRYLYIAKGREAVARHMKEMGGVAAGSTSAEGVEAGPKIMRKSGEEEKVGAWDTVARIEARCAKLEAERALPGKREERMLRRAMGLDEDDSERLISLSTAYSTSIQRLHAHILRIYTPVFKQLARLPSTFTDGTQLQMLDTVTTRLTDGSAFRFAGRLVESFGTVRGQLDERRKRARDEKGPGEGEGGAFGGFGGFGGMQPPVPPSPSPPASEAGESAGGKEGGEAPPPPPRGKPVIGPDGKQYPPGTKVTVINCVVM
ncbi:hypothetical protein JCM10207_005011 [Rhodosporidiobolus poonsookiae]